MGQRGKAPAPLSLKLLKGNIMPSRLGLSPGPVAPPPKPPLTTDAEVIWDRTLACSDHIGQRHLEVFRQFCETAATLNAMQPKGSKEWRELVLVNLRLARELCLTPATGAHLSRPEAPARKLDKYITG